MITQGVVQQLEWFIGAERCDLQVCIFVSHLNKMAFPVGRFNKV